MNIIGVDEKSFKGYVENLGLNYNDVKDKGILVDDYIRIPMAGSIESLNAAVAAGILMYQSRIIK